MTVPRVQALARRATGSHGEAGMTPEQAAILALLDTVQRLERRIAALEHDAAKDRVLTAERKVENHFTGLKVVNGRRGVWRKWLISMPSGGINEASRTHVGSARPALEHSDWIRSRIMSHRGQYPDSIGLFNPEQNATGGAA